MKIIVVYSVLEFGGGKDQAYLGLTPSVLA